MLMIKLHRLAPIIAVALILAGCAGTSDIAAKKEQDAKDLWAAMGHDGPMPANDAASIRAVVAGITQRSSDILLNGSTAVDCAAYSTAFDGLVVADFSDGRKAYIELLSNDISQVSSTCEKGTWQGAIAAVEEIAQVGGEYLAKY